MKQWEGRGKGVIKGSQKVSSIILNVNLFLISNGPGQRPTRRPLTARHALAVNFINVIRTYFLYESLFWQLFLVTFWLWQKICTKNSGVKP